MAKATKSAPQTKALVSYQDRLAGLSRQAKGVEAHVTTGKFISCRGGRFSIGGNMVQGDSIDCIVVTHSLENHYYTTEYDADNPTSPDCFSFGLKESEMQPHPDCESPQSENCKDCPMNKFNTAARGRGKACGNIRRLGLILLEDINNAADAEILYLKVPVTSVGAWAQHVTKLAAMELPPLGVVTRIEIAPDAKTQFRLGFSAVEKVADVEGVDADATLGALLDRYDPVYEELTKPYPKNEERTQAAPAQKQNTKLAGGRTPAKLARR